MRGYHIVITVDNESIDTKAKGIKTFTPKHVFQRLPAHRPALSYRRQIIVQEKKDYRLGPLQLDWMDFETSSTAIQSLSAGKEKEQRRGPAEATFVPTTRSKSGSTNLPEGIVHIFRDTGKRPSPEELAAKAPKQFETEDPDGVTLGVLAVPSWMTPSDFLNFIEPVVDNVAHLRIIRDSAPNRSIALIKFVNPADATEFAEVYNGKPFNSMETKPEICHVVHILSVQIAEDDNISRAISRISSTYGPAQELPTCPVCLERMDAAVTGLITVPCSHTFHCMCLSRWGDSRCPVCRYTQNLLTSHPASSTTRPSRSLPFAPITSTPAASSCSECPSTTNLWICLICGNIGCGRYGRAHAHAHYQATTHLYALELETQRVWDYAGDGYVHRLIQNKADGKLVELPSAASSMGTSPVSNREGGLGPSQADALSAEKIEAIGIEYSYLLTSQLDSQRAYYEERTAEMKTQLDELRAVIERVNLDRQEQEERRRQDEMRRAEEKTKRIAELEKEKAKVEQRAGKMMELSRRLEKELREERAVSEGLMTNIKSMKGKLEAAEKGKEECMQRIGELEDQVRDLMFFIDAKSKIESGEGASAEAAGGTVERIASGSSVNRKSAKKNKKG